MNVSKGNDVLYIFNDVHMKMMHGLVVIFLILPDVTASWQ